MVSREKNPENLQIQNSSTRKNPEPAAIAKGDEEVDEGSDEENAEAKSEKGKKDRQNKGKGKPKGRKGRKNES